MRFRLFVLVSASVIALVILALPAIADEGHTEPAEQMGETEHHGEGGHRFKNAFPLFLGTAYFFDVGSRFGIGPAVNLDVVEGDDVWVYGVNFEVVF